MAKKKREDTNQVAFRVIQEVIERTENPNGKEQRNMPVKNSKKNSSKASGVSYNDSRSGN